MFNLDKWDGKTYRDIPSLNNFLSDKYKGAVVKDLRCYGDAIFLRKEYIEAAVYNRLEKLPDEERDEYSRFENIPDDFAFVRHTVVAAPFFIDFEDGRSLEFFFTDEGVRVGENAPQELFEGATNFKPEGFFRQALSKTVSHFEVRDEDGKIDSVNMMFESGHHFRFGRTLTFTAVSLYGRNGQLLPVTFGEIKKHLLY